MDGWVLPNHHPSHASQRAFFHLCAQNLELMEREGSEELGPESPQQLSKEDGPGSSPIPRACSR